MGDCIQNLLILIKNLTMTVKDLFILTLHSGEVDLH